jgi:hypothetical protein
MEVSRLIFKIWKVVAYIHSREINKLKSGILFAKQSVFLSEKGFSITGCYLSFHKPYMATHTWAYFKKAHLVLDS